MANPPAEVGEKERSLWRRTAQWDCRSSAAPMQRLAYLTGALGAAAPASRRRSPAVSPRRFWRQAVLNVAVCWAPLLFLALLISHLWKCRATIGLAGDSN